MVVIETLQLTAIIGMCLVTSITDIRSGRIKNKHITIFAIIATIINILYYGIFVRELLLTFILNFVIIIFISILLYAYKIWAAGDAKLLIVLVYLLPARIYYSNTTSISSSVWLIILTFSLAFLYLLVESIVLGIKYKDLFKFRPIKINIIEIIKQYLLCMLYLSLFSKLLALPLFQNFRNDNASLVMLASVLLLLSILNTRIFRNIYMIIATSTGFILLLVYSKFSILGSFNYKWFLIILLVTILRFIAEKYNYKIILTKNIKAGMILSWSSIALFLPSRIQGLPISTTEDMDSRLTSQQVSDILRWKDSKYGMPELSVVRKIPFAIFISVGFIFFSIVRFLYYGR